MLRLRKSFRFLILICVLGPWGLGCTTHHYYPLSAQHALVQPEDLAALRLENLQIEARCTWRSEHGTVVRAPELCRKIRKLFNAKSKAQKKNKRNEADAELEESASQDDKENEDSKMLTLLVDGRMLANQYTHFDHALLYLTFGLYPATTDRWHAIDVRVYDEQNRLLEAGRFKALFRSTYGWGYWVFDRLLGFGRSDLPHRYAEPNSRDFYLFTSQLVYNARMLQLAEASSEKEED